MSSPRDVSSRLRQNVWNGSIPLEIRLHKGDCRTYDSSEPYLIQFPRISYLGFLVPKLHAFFRDSLIHPDVSSTEAWLSFEDVPLKWHYALGLLYDLYSGAEPAQASENTSAGYALLGEEEESLPWKLTVHFSGFPAQQLVRLDGEGKVLHDLFINSVKEADYLRNGTGKTIMSLNKDDSTQLWTSVKEHDLSQFHPINQKLLNPQGANIRHIPVKLYLPHSASDSKIQEEKDKEAVGSLRVVQSLVTPSLSSRQPQTVGSALKQILPSLFPSTRSALHAHPVLHGAVLPLAAGVEDLLRSTAYVDGWLHVAVVMMG
ncbi:autophagy protein 5 [Polyplosphaeria fusca]|uniref:Autophagy protein 5 n=1 Tax=Polyplosphaeria fusca TaxID=682080 RepID=A0A9P4V4L1_9PLEO|nr:autophagy protein 5 [Polyplosphaeria fusca]